MDFCLAKTLRNHSLQEQCYNCGGWGHTSRECPSDRGAKGGKAKGKVKGLDKGVGKGGKGGGDGGTKGKGRGYQGTYYTCGKVGHKAWECPARNVNAVQDESEGEMEEVVDVGTIWNVGHVETVDVMAVLEVRRQRTSSRSLWIRVLAPVAGQLSGCLMCR